MLARYETRRGPCVKESVVCHLPNNETLANTMGVRVVLVKRSFETGLVIQPPWSRFPTCCCPSAACRFAPLGHCLSGVLSPPEAMPFRLAVAIWLDKESDLSKTPFTETMMFGW